MSSRKTHPQDRPPNTLSICMIVKNEEHHLGDCLKSVQGFSEQIVVVDTGSADNTVKVADSFGAKVTHSNWSNDFSYSRNISLDQATCRWILWLDADDRVPPSEIEKFTRLKSAPPDQAFFMMIRNVRRGGFGEQWFQLRMFPNHPGIRFERKIHEQILPSLGRLRIPTKQVDVRIDHLGYENPKMQRDKARRNLGILFADLANHPDDPLYLAAIANSYFVIEEFGEAIKWYKRILETPNGHQKHPDLYLQTPTSIGLCLKNLGDLSAAWEWIETALADNPRKIDSLFIGAELREKMEDPSGAAELYERVLQAPPLCSSCPVDPDTMKAKSLLCLGRFYTKAGRWDKGEAAYRKCAEKYPAVSQAFRELGELLWMRENFHEAAKNFHRAIDLRPGEPKAYLGLAKALLSAGRAREAAEVLEEMKKLFPPAPKADLMRPM
jgi:glycosyltransferase involved in cell wall biosynthesis